MHCTLLHPEPIGGCGRPELGAHGSTKPPIPWGHWPVARPHRTPAVDPDLEPALLRGSVKKCGQASRCVHKTRAKLWARRRPRSGPESDAGGRCGGRARLPAAIGSRKALKQSCMGTRRQRFSIVPARLAAVAAVPVALSPPIGVLLPQGGQPGHDCHPLDRRSPRPRRANG